MARINRVREGLLAQAKAAERRAAAKVRRNEANGIRIRGSEYDPRRGAANLNDLTTRQLRNHLRGLEQFNSRDTQFTGLAEGQPVPRDLWRQYERLERTNNQTVTARENALSNIPLVGEDNKPPGRRSTIGSRNRILADPVYGRTFQRFNQDPRGVEGVAALNKLIARLKRRTAPRFTSTEANKKMKSVKNMLNGARMGDYYKEIAKLTPDQKNVLFEHSQFMSVVRDNIEDSPTTKGGIQAILDENFRSQTGRERIDDARQNVRELIDWVKRVVPEDGQLPNNVSTRKNPNTRRRKS